MEIQLTGRGVALTGAMHRVVEAKVEKIPHWEPRATRAEVEISVTHNPKLEKVKRVDIAVDIPKRRFRAHGEAEAVETAVEQAVERLGRQMKESRHKKRRSVVHGASRVKSAQRNTRAGGSRGED